MIITAHAMQRYRERVRDIPEPEIALALSGRAFDAAETMPRCAIILPTGHRAVCEHGHIITILPLGGHAFFGPYRDRGKE